MLLYLSLITVLLTAILSFNYGAVNRTSFYLFGAFLCIAFYELSHYVLILSKNAFWVAVFYNHFSSLLLLIGPLLFLYVRATITDRTRLQQNDLLHFLPAFLHFLGTLPWFFKPFSEKYAVALQIVENIDVMKSFHQNFFFTVQGAFVLRPLSILVYVLSSFFLIWKYAQHGHIHKGIPVQQFKITYRWLLALLGSILILGLNYIFLVFLYLDYNKASSFHIANTLQAICGAVLIIPTLLLFIYPRVLLGFPMSRQKTDPVSQDATSEFDAESEVPEHFKTLAKEIETIFASDARVYAIDFSLEDLANILGQPTHHVSYCINHVMFTRFTDLRLEHRVNYAKKLLLDNASQAFTIESIANQAGFKTRSNFYNAFKQVTGTTPTEFMKLHRSSSPEA